MSVDLHARLRKVLGPSRPADGQLREPTDRAARGDEPLARQRDIQDLVDGSVIEGPLGACFVAEQTLALDHRHGQERLGRFFEVTDRSLGCLARSAEPLDIDRESIVFLDTETTGLAGGTGTYAFMVGLAYFRGDQLLVRQYFMRHHAEEPAMLAALAQVLGRHEAVVTFNGKSFDVPLLLTRYSANRQRHTVPADLHLDLLHPSRRFWRETLESCTLGTLERAVLGHTRGADVPGWMIPDLYFRYLRGADPGPMAMVFEHNLHDLLSLVALTCRLGRLLEAPPSNRQGAPARVTDGDQPDPTGDQADPAGVSLAAEVTAPGRNRSTVLELFAAARIYEDLGLWDDALARYEQALNTGRAVDLRARVASRLAALCKRAGRHERAIELWRRLASLGVTGCEPYVELAKHFEHRLHDYDAALEMVEEALAVIEIQELRKRPGTAAERAELEHRRTRLHQKRLRARGAAVSTAAPDLN